MLQDEMTSEDVTYWIAQQKRGIAGELVWDYRFGVLASLLGLVLQSMGNKQISANPSSYFPSLKKLKVTESKPEQTPEEQYKILMQWAIAMGAEVKRE